LARQLCTHLDTQTQVLPATAVLPPHHGLIITHGLHLLGLSVAPGVAGCSARALVGLAEASRPAARRYQHPELVRTHGQFIRQAEQAEVAALLQQPDLARLEVQRVPHDQPQRRARWPKELKVAEVLETRISDLQARQAWLPNYRQPRREQQ
jgi:hypothetical protein